MIKKKKKYTNNTYTARRFNLFRRIIWTRIIWGLLYFVLTTQQRNYINLSHSFFIYLNVEEEKRIIRSYTYRVLDQKEKSLKATSKEISLVSSRRDKRCIVFPIHDVLSTTLRWARRFNLGDGLTPPITRYFCARINLKLPFLYFLSYIYTKKKKRNEYVTKFQVRFYEKFRIIIYY